MPPPSRRQFIRPAAGGVSLAWTGIRITAGQGDDAGPAKNEPPVRSSAIIKRPFCMARAGSPPHVVKPDCRYVTSPHPHNGG